MKNRETFFQLLAAIDGVKNKHHALAPDIDAQLLLMRIAMAHHHKAPLNVSQAMNLRQIGSPAMALVFEGNNRRTKYLEPSSKAYAIIDAMADAVAAIEATVD